MPIAPLGWDQLVLYPLLATLGLWGGLTIGLLWANRCGPKVGRVLLGILGLGLLLAHQQLWEVRNDLSIWGCYRAFAAGMLIWAWHELAFYSGVLTGPWRVACPPNVRGWQRFSYALATHLYHELAVGVEVLALWWIHRDATNVFGPLTFVLLWALLHSAKLNVLLGVRSLTVDWLPAHLRYLGSFWRRRPRSFFFLPSTLAISLLALGTWNWAYEAAPHSSAVGLALLAAIATLGALEHWALVLPNQRHAANMQRQSSTVSRQLSE